MHYHDTVVNANITRDKAGVAMLASTERGGECAMSVCTTRSIKFCKMRFDNTGTCLLYIT